MTIRDVLLFCVENWPYWSLMFFAGLTASWGRSAWRWIGVFALAFLPLFSLPGAWINNPNGAVTAVMFILVGGLAGLVIGLLLRRKAAV